MYKQGYTGYRPDILRLMSGSPSRVLDVGCGAGALGASIKQKWPDAIVVGIDNDPQLLASAAIQLDKVIQCDLNANAPLAGLAGEEPFDVILFADVLEHLVNPEALLSMAREYLTDMGYVITSLPNVRHYSTFVSLGLFGSWPRRERGIHDKTHLRFFARADMLRLFSDCGYRQVMEKRNVRLIESQSWSNIPGKIFDFWPLRPFLTFQYMHKLVPAS